MIRQHFASCAALVLVCGAYPGVVSAAGPSQTDAVQAPAPEPAIPEAPAAAQPDALPADVSSVSEGPPAHEGLWPPCAGVETGASLEERRAAADREILDAERAFRNGDTEVALAHVEFAECHHPADPDYDFMRAVIHASNLDCAESRAAADAYLATGPNEADASALRDRMGTCAPPIQSLTVSPPPRPDPPPPPDRKRPGVDADAGRAWHRDPLGGALLGVGLVSSAIGTGLVIGGRRISAEDSTNYAEFQDNTRRSTSLKIAGGTVLGVGLGLTVGAVVRYIVVANRTPGSRAAGRTAARRQVATDLLSPVVRF